MKYTIFNLLIISLFLFSSGCNNSNTTIDDAGEALGYAEKVMRDKNITTASSYQPNGYAKFRIMADENTSKEEAKQLVEEFIQSFENQLTDKEKFYKTHEMIFDIKSSKDGKILYSGKKDKEIWWQF
ncbi:hypothetical protein [Cohnella sp. WQ 127256]|uniref:hypothetical protein n=1 Tax=Cohnella sp. WQ 127256 TaxID=2938790 RepID=UPI002118C947|nr:hypothetical protein [Cohnella sp. WQ 127256]